MGAVPSPKAGAAAAVGQSGVARGVVVIEEEWEEEEGERRRSKNRKRSMKFYHLSTESTIPPALAALQVTREEELTPNLLGGP